MAQRGGAIAKPIVRLYGPVGIETGDGKFVKAPGGTPAAILALLAARQSPIETGELIFLVWGDEQPSTASASLRNHIARLNKAARTANLHPLVEHASVGYHLNRALVTSDAEVIASALGTRSVFAMEHLCVGDPLAGAFRNVEIDALASRLTHLRTELREEVIERHLSAGNDDEVIRRVREELTHQLYNDRIVGQLMVALARSGKSQEALEAFQQHRTRLIEDLGIEPSAALVEIENKVLHGDSPQAPVTSPQAFRGWLHHSEQPLVGREVQLDAVEEGLRSKRSVLVLGEAGAGKSHLLDEVIHRADRQFETVVVAIADPEGETNQVWRDIARVWSRSADRRSEAEQFLACTAADSGVEAQPAIVLEAALAMVEAATRDGQALVVIDDAHWCDPPSLALCRRLLGANEQLSLLCAARPSQAHNPLHDRSEIVSVAPLDLSTITELTANRLGLNAGEARRHARKLLGQTGGNALFVTSLLRHEADVKQQSGSSPDLPADLSSILRHSVAVLPEPTQRALEVAAVTGVRFPAAVLARTLESVDGVGLETVEPAQRAGLILEPDRGTLAFNHDVLRTVIYHDMPSIRRSTIHSALALDFAEAGGHQISHAAWHACRSVPFTPAEQAIEIALSGAERAERHHAFQPAQALYAESLAIVDALGPDEFRPVALLGIARTLALGGHHADAVRTLVEAERSVVARDDSELDELLVRSARVFARYLRGDPAPLDVLERITTELPEGSNRINASTEHMMAEFVMRGWTDAAERSASLVEDSATTEIPLRLVALFRELGGPRQDETLRLARTLLDSGEDDWWDRGLLDRIGFQTEISALLWTGQLDEAQARASVMAASEAARGMPILRWMARAVEVDISLTRGRFDRTRVLLDELLISGQEWEIADTAAIHLGLVLSESYVTRRPDPRLGALVHRPVDGPTSFLLAGLEGIVHWNNGRADEAARCLAVGAELAISEHRSNVYAGALMATCTLAVELDADQAVAQQIFGLLLPYSGTTPRFGQVGGHLGPADRILALLARSLGDGRAASRFAFAAAQQARTMQAKPWIDRCEALLTDHEP